MLFGPTGKLVIIYIRKTVMETSRKLMLQFVLSKVKNTNTETDFRSLCLSELAR